MSDNEDFDGEFQGLRLKKTTKTDGNAQDFFNKPLRPSKMRTIEEDEKDDWFGESKKVDNSPKSFETSFSGTFLEERSLFARGGRGFGDWSDDGEDSEKEAKPEEEEEEKEEFVGVDWDVNAIFKNLTCPETQTEKSVCVLRLHDVLTKAEFGVQKMTRQLMHCGKRVQSYNPIERRDFGFTNEPNLKDLNQMLSSLRSSLNLMLLETEDLQKSINPPVPSKWSWRIPKKYLIAAGIVAVLVLSACAAEKPQQ